MWWPWGKSQTEKNDLGLDKDLKEYMEHPNAIKETVLPPREAPRKTSDGIRDRAKTLRQIAMDNCVEYEQAYSKCLLRGTLWQRFQSCPDELAMYEQCKTLQTQALTVLGYQAAKDDKERASIKAKADDLMIATVPTLVITEGQVKNFESEVAKLEKAK